MLDIGSLVPQWNPKEPPMWLVKTMNRIGPDPAKARPKGLAAGTRNESFSDYWHRTQREDTQRFARDEEVMERA